MMRSPCDLQKTCGVFLIDAVGSGETDTLLQVDASVPCFFQGILVLADVVGSQTSGSFPRQTMLSERRDAPQMELGTVKSSLFGV